ncbi:MAG: beta-ketoacyl synthase chain length factor [Rhizobacter sp.]|nr:beta-ketoacyl synthase chain length factor [Rhizobacter sp.]
MKACIQGIGLLGPGLTSWAEAQAVLRGSQPHATNRTLLKPPARLPNTERRRAGEAIKLAMAVADEALGQAGLDAKAVATVFASSNGEGINCHSICEALASGDRLLSPTRFTNSVHNAPAGYWHIAAGSRTTSTSLCAFDDSFAAGFLEALTQLPSSKQPVLLVASDAPYPEPLNATRPLPDAFGVAFVLTREAGPETLATLQVELEPLGAAGGASICEVGSIEALRRQVPAARALPLLQCLAQGRVGASVLLDFRGTSKLRIRVEPHAC